MTLRIEITVPEEAVHAGKADFYVSTAMAAIGYSRGQVLSAVVREFDLSASVTGDDYAPGDEVQTMDEADATEAADELVTTAAAVRLRGKAGEGRRRRTNVEIAEDEALEAAALAAGVDIAKVDAKLAEGVSRDVVMTSLSGMTTDNAAEPDGAMQISTGEERLGPEDSPETIAQDAADEAAEAAAARGPADGPTHVDLTDAVSRYQKKFGMEAAIADTPIILGSAIADVAKEDLAAAIQKVEAAIANGRPGSAAAPAATTITPATKAQVGEALMNYARKFDGPGFDPTDESTFPITNEDGCKVFSMLFGEGVTKLRQVPDAGDGIAFGRALAGIREMTEKNPFKREVK